MPAADCRIAALKRTVERRTRLEETLRSTLAGQREERGRLEAARDAKREAVREERDLLQTYHDRIARMMCGEEPFSLANMNASMRYTEIVEERLRGCEKALAEAEEMLRAQEEEVAAMIRTIASNRGRIDICKDRIEDIERTLETAASDIADEEAEEAVLACMRAAGPSTV
jgi:type III secretion system HrpB7-like protein